MKFRDSISLIVVVCLLSALALAQSLGDVARDDKANKADAPHAKKVYTNEDIEGAAQQRETAEIRLVQENSEQQQDSTKAKQQDTTTPAPAVNVANSTPTSASNPSATQARPNADAAPPSAGRRGVLLPGARKNAKKTTPKKLSTPEPVSAPKNARQEQHNPKDAVPSEPAPATAKATPAPQPAETKPIETKASANTKAAETTPAEEAKDAAATPSPASQPAASAANPPIPLTTPEDNDVTLQQPPIANSTPFPQPHSPQKDVDDERDPMLPPPLSGNATFTAGFYEADTKNGHTTHEASPAASALFDINGYLHHPDFLKFNFKPQTSVGKQSSEAVFPDGQGIAASATFLGGSVAPLTVSYSKLDRKIVTFGPLDRLAGLDAKTNQDALTVNWRVRLRRLPELTMNFSRFNDGYEPLENLAPKTDNHARLFTLGAQQKIAGWNLQSDLHVEDANQKLINLFDPTQAPYDYGRKDRDIRASADRDFDHKFLVNVNGGASDGKSQINDVPYDQSFRYVSGSGILRPSDRFSLAFRAGLTTNVVGFALANTLNPNGTTTTQSQPITLLPNQAHVTMQNYGTQATYSLTNDLHLDGDVSHESSSTPTINSLVAPDSSLNSLQAGIGYSHHFSWFKFQSRYAANGGNFEYGTTGTSRSLGHRANVDVTFGSLRSVELTVSGQGSLQDMNGPTTMHDQTWGGSVSASRMFGGSKLELSANIDKNAYRYALANYNTFGKGGGITLTNSLVDFSAMYQLRDGLTVQADPRLQFLTATQLISLEGAFPSALIVPTTSSFTTATVSVHPAARLTARATWMSSRQAVAVSSHNRYNQWEASAGYQFRSLNLDFGYIHHDQDFGVDFFRRNRVYFRIVRQFRMF